MTGILVCAGAAVILFGGLLVAGMDVTAARVVAVMLLSGASVLVGMALEYLYPSRTTSRKEPRT